MDRLRAVQALRALAACMVLIGHVIAEAEYYMGLSLAIGRLPWTRGVDIFFVISGFIIALSGRRYFGTAGGAADFALRRIIRVVPLYWFFTTLMLVTLLVMPGGVKETVLDPGQVLSSYAFIPYARSDGRVAPILSLGWTLNYEIFFYVIFAAFLTIRWPRGMILVLGTILSLAAIGAFIDPPNTVLAAWTNAILIEFGFGILLAECWMTAGHRIRPGFSKGAFILCGGLALLALLNLDGSAPFGLPRFLASGVPAAIIVAGPILFWQGAVAARLPHWSQVLGDSSYALYLSHRFVLRLATLMILPLLPASTGGAVLYVVLVCGAATWAGVLVFRHVETPMLTALTSRLLPAAARQRAEPA